MSRVRDSLAPTERVSVDPCALHRAASQRNTIRRAAEQARREAQRLSDLMLSTEDERATIAPPRSA